MKNGFCLPVHPSHDAVFFRCSTFKGKQKVLNFQRRDLC